MAIYHFTVSVVSRSKGHSAVAKAAALSGTKLRDERLGLVANSSRKKGVLHAEIVTPEHAPQWMRHRESLWNGVEAAGARKNAQLAREVGVALSSELTFTQQLALMRQFIQEQFVTAGMVVDFAIHDSDKANPYGKMLLTTQYVGRDGFGRKNRDWNSIACLVRWRAAWAAACNAALEKAGHDVRIDHRSFAARGLGLEAPPKRPKRLQRNDARGQAYVDEQMAKYNDVVRRNGQAILDDPTIAVRVLSQKHKPYTQQQLVKFLQANTVGQQQFAACLQGVLELASDRPK